MPVPLNPDDPTWFTGGVSKIMSRLMNGNTNKAIEGLKLLGWLFAFALLAFIGITHDWIGVTKQGAVDTTRLAAVEKSVSEVYASMPRDYERRDVAEIQFTILKRDVEDVKQQNLQMQKTLDQVLFELRRR